jgi:hypothetical protein
LISYSVFVRLRVTVHQIFVDFENACASGALVYSHSGVLGNFVILTIHIEG